MNTAFHQSATPISRFTGSQPPRKSLETQTLEFMMSWRALLKSFSRVIAPRYQTLWTNIRYILNENSSNFITEHQAAEFGSTSSSQSSSAHSAALRCGTAVGGWLTDCLQRRPSQQSFFKLRGGAHASNRAPRCFSNLLRWFSSFSLFLSNSLSVLTKRGGCCIIE